MTPQRFQEEKTKIHKSREQTLYLILVCLNISTTTAVTAFLMEGPNNLSSLPLSSASQEFLLLGGALAIICHLISCFLLVLFYRRCHVWSEIGNSRDINNGCCCNWCSCWRWIGRICFQEDPVIGETPFWEKVIVFFNQTWQILFRRLIPTKLSSKETLHKHWEGLLCRRVSVWVDRHTPYFQGTSVLLDLT